MTFALKLTKSLCISLDFNTVLTGLISKPAKYCTVCRANEFSVKCRAGGGLHHFKIFPSHEKVKLMPLFFLQFSCLVLFFCSSLIGAHELTSVV